MFLKWSRTVQPSRTMPEKASETHGILASGSWPRIADSLCRRSTASLASIPRYAGKQGDDEANNRKLLIELRGCPTTNVRVYVCVAALADPQGQVHAVTEGRCHGVIIKERRGTGGFGYDPLFLIPEYHKTFGELSARVKHALSHRAKALTQLRPALRHLLLQFREDKGEL